jgi:endonuclease III
MTAPEVSTEAAQNAISRLANHIPHPECELNFRTPFELLVATILSAQCTDERVNQVTPGLFARFPTAEDISAAEPSEVETLIHSTGFYKAKTKSLQACCRGIIERFGGEMPAELGPLCELPGVGRKTANLLLGVAFGKATGVVVDTHAGRVSQRLGLTTESKPEKIEKDLMELVPSDQWIDFGHRLILHGRRTCKSKNPKCDECEIRDACPQIGVS